MQRIKLDNLGRFVDGWAHLVEGEADKAPALRERLHQALTLRHMPNVAVSTVQGCVATKEPDRPFLLTKTPPGYTTVAYIAEHGKDLYVSWRTYYSPPRSFESLMAVSPLILLMIWFLVFSGADYLYSRISNWEEWGLYNAWEGAKFWRDVISVLVGAAVFLVGLFLEGKLEERATHQNRRAELIAYLAILVVAVGVGIATWRIYPSYINMPSPAPKPPLFSFSFTTRLLSATAIAVWGTTVTILYNLLFQSASLTEFASVFDDDDAIAMSLSVHKSLVHVLDEVGIDTSDLRLHNETIQSRSREPV